MLAPFTAGPSSTSKHLRPATRLYTPIRRFVSPGVTSTWKEDEFSRSYVPPFSLFFGQLHEQCKIKPLSHFSVAL